MDIIFFGTSDFAVSALEALTLSRHKVLAVVTACDKGKGRGQKLTFSPVKIFAQKNNLTISQPANLRHSKFIKFLQDFPADIFVVCDYGKILTKEVLQIPQLYAINLHTSLLPKYRGAAPINWAIIKGETETGLTIFKMNQHMDRGRIILQQKIDILPTDTAQNLKERLSQIAPQVLLQAINAIEQKKVSLRKQNESQASFAPKLKKEDGLIDWRLSASEIHNRVRGLQPWPGAFTYLKSKLLKIWETKVVDSETKQNPGQILEVDGPKGILVQTGKGRLLITALQLEGKRKMSATEFISGHKLELGKRLGC